MVKAMKRIILSMLIAVAMILTLAACSEGGSPTRSDAPTGTSEAAEPTEPTGTVKPTEPTEPTEVTEPAVTTESSSPSWRPPEPTEIDYSFDAMLVELGYQAKTVEELIQNVQKYERIKSIHVFNDQSDFEKGIQVFEGEMQIGMVVKIFFDEVCWAEYTIDPLDKSSRAGDLRSAKPKAKQELSPPENE